MSEQQNVCRISSNSYEYGHSLWNSVEPPDGDHLRKFANNNYNLNYLTEWQQFFHAINPSLKTSDVLHIQQYIKNHQLDHQ